MKTMMILAAAMVAAQIGGAAAGDLSGKAFVFDGDTLSIDRVRVRLLGIDAPEKDQTCLDGAGAVWPCGRVATNELMALVRGQTVTCTLTGLSSGERQIGRCQVNQVDLGQVMVERGLAVAVPKFDWAYVPAELQARAGKRGLWAGSFVRPCRYRGSC